MHLLKKKQSLPFLSSLGLSDKMQQAGINSNGLMEVFQGITLSIVLGSMLSGALIFFSVTRVCLAIRVAVFLVSRGMMPGGGFGWLIRDAKSGGGGFQENQKGLFGRVLRGEFCAQTFYHRLKIIYEITIIETRFDVVDAHSRLTVASCKSKTNDSQNTNSSTIILIRQHQWLPTDTSGSVTTPPSPAHNDSLQAQLGKRCNKKITRTLTTTTDLSAGKNCQS